MTAAWAGNYIGIPWRDKGRDRRGCDCWGLVRLALCESLGIDLPSYDDSYRTAGPAGVAMADELFSSQWPLPGWVEVPPTQAREGAIALFGIGGFASHVGLICGPDEFLHVLDGGTACIDRLWSVRWRNRLIGAFRYVG